VHANLFISRFENAFGGFPDAVVLWFLPPVNVAGGLSKVREERVARG
jgi:hypothetical protein